MTPAIKLLRPSHWVKNIFVFLPLFFNGSALDPRLLLHCAAAFAMFCMAASAVYCINDVLDRKADREHPKKRLRPVASGAVSPALALTIALALTLLSIALALAFVPAPAPLIATILAYMVMNIAYSLWLKHLAIIDVMVVALGFVLRIVAGGIACDIFLSSWIIIMTFLITLLIAMAKRRSDFLIQQKAGNAQRESVRNYSPLFMNVSIGILAAMSVFGYIMYSLSAPYTGPGYFYITSIFVIAGVLRYLMLVFARDEGDEPVTMLARDRGLQFCVLAWLITVSLLLYL